MTTGFYHRGMAQEIGVTEKALEKMTIVELFQAYRAKEVRLEWRAGGEGPGLTCNAVLDGQVETQRTEG